MKQETIDTLYRNLIEDKKRYEKFKRYEDFVYKIEFVPVLTERNKNGKLNTLTAADERILFAVENKKFYED